MTTAFAVISSDLFPTDRSMRDFPYILATRITPEAVEVLTTEGFKAIPRGWLEPIPGQETSGRPDFTDPRISESGLSLYLGPDFEVAADTLWKLDTLWTDQDPWDNVVACGGLGPSQGGRP